MLAADGLHELGFSRDRLARSSNSTSSMAAASSGRPACVYSSIIRRLVASRNSSVAGMTPPATMAATVRVASPVVANVALSVARASGRGTSRNVASVITPSVPSDPTKRPTRS